MNLWQDIRFAVRLLVKDRWFTAVAAQLQVMGRTSARNTTYAMPAIDVVNGRAQVVIPAGARLLGQTKPVQTFGETRLAVAFHRLLLPDWGAL